MQWRPLYYQNKSISEGWGAFFYLHAVAREKKEKKGGGWCHENQREITRGKGPRNGGVGMNGEIPGEWYWANYISALCALYEYVRTYSISICDYNAPEKCGRKTKRKKEE